MDEFDEVFNTKMTNGKYHFCLAIIGAFINLLDGSFFTIIPFCIRFLQNDYFLSDDEASSIQSVLMAGSILAGPLGAYSLNTIGRRKTLVIGIFIGANTAIAFYFSYNLTTILISTTVLGMYMLTATSCLMLYLVETFTGPNKGKSIVGVYSFFSIGRLYGAVMARFTLAPYQFDQWKQPFLINSLILTVLFIFILFFLKESVKFSFHKKRFIEATTNFNAIQYFNHKKSHLIENDMLLTLQEVKKLAGITSSKIHSNNKPISQKMSKMKTFKLVFNFSGMIICSLFVNFFQSMAVPNIMGTDTGTLTGNIVIMMGELFGALIMFSFIEHKSMGRKKIIMLSHFLLIFIFTIPIIFPDVSLTAVMFVSKIFIKSSLSMAFIHMNESLPISIRDKSVLACTTIANVSTIAVPYLFYYAFHMNKEAVFLMISYFALFGFIFDIFSPNDFENISTKMEESDDTSTVRKD